VDFENTAAIERIKAKLAHLRGLDPAYKVFGSSSHRYRPGPPLTAPELADCEKKFGVRLPAGYRDFVMQVGNGGVGPFYGLFQLNGFDLENPTDLDQIKKPFRWTNSTNPTQWQSSGPEDGVLIKSDGEEGESYLEWWIVPGVLYICNYGCAIRFFLVVNGPQSGEVWMDMQAEDYGIVPERGEDGNRLHFLQWYEKWLDDGISMFRKEKAQ
jgi:SMI1 / KNR4 family (SUKH-1)